MDLTKFDLYLAGKLGVKTVPIYMSALRRFVMYCGSREPTGELAQQYVDGLRVGHGSSVVNIAGHAIMRWFRWKGADIHLDLPGITMKDPEYIETAVLFKLLHMTNDKMYIAILTVLFDTAVRISELLGLKMSDINWDLGVISVKRKGGRIETVNISKKAMDTLSAWIVLRDFESENVFGDLEYGTVWRWMRDLGKKAGIKLHPHMLRHSRAIQMLKAGTQPYVVQQALGHRRLSTTMDIYGKFTTLDLKKQIPSW